MQQTPPAPAGRLTLLAWIIGPALAAICLALLALNWLTAVAGPAPVTAVVVTPISVAIAPAAPTLFPTITVDLPQPTVPPTVAPAAAPTLPSPTADAHALAVLSELPSSLGDVTPTEPSLPSTEPPLPTAVPTVIPIVPPSATPLPPTAVTAAATGPTDPLTGLPADPVKLARVPLVVMIDNHPDAAPQTGLNAADLVIEALAEGGITRFETFFLSGDAPTVGPIRSARPYFVEWAYPFQPFYVHCGGSWEAVDLIAEAAGRITNVDCFDGNMPFWRSNDRLMPHNLYAGTTQLWKLADKRGIHAPATLPGFLHSPPLPVDQRPSSGTLSFVFSGLSRSDITWVYDPAGNSYLRKQWGYWHRDLATGETVSAKNVVVLWTNVWDLPGDEKGRMGTDTVGAGTALILRDGQPEWGYWSRATPQQPLNLYNGRRDPMALVPGRTWIEVLGVGKKVTLGP